jgi:hypothetical protein
MYHPRSLYSSRPTQPYHFQADLIWCDGTFKRDIENTVLTKVNPAHTKENTVLTKVNTVLAKENTVLTKEITVLTNVNTVLTEENTVLMKVN